jgi:hypothetical protein
MLRRRHPRAQQACDTVRTLRDADEILQHLPAQDGPAQA